MAKHDAVERILFNIDNLTDSEKQQLLLKLLDENHDNIEEARGKAEIVDLFGDDFDMAEFMREQAAGDRVEGLSTGYWTLDRMTTGLKPGELVIVAAPSGLGKTLLCLNMAARQAVSGHKVVFISLENGAKSLQKRLYSITTKEYFPFLVEDHAFRIQKCNNLTLSTLKFLMENAKQSGAEIVYLDHIHRFVGEMRDPKTELGAAAYMLRDLSVEHKIPIVAIAQLRKIPKGEEATVEDIRDSDFIRQAADTVIVGNFHKTEDGRKYPKFTLGKRRDAPLWYEGSEVCMARSGSDLEEPPYSEALDAHNDILGEPRGKGDSPLTFKNIQPIMF